MNQDQVWYSCDFSPCFMAYPTQTNCLNEIVYHYEKNHLPDIAAMITLWTKAGACTMEGCKFATKHHEGMIKHLPYHGRYIIALYFELQIKYGQNILVNKSDVCTCSKPQKGLLTGKCLLCGKLVGGSILDSYFA